MVTLLICIILTSYLTLVFKLAGRMGLNNLQVILINYATCVVTGIGMEGNISQTGLWTRQPWFGWSLLQGITLIVVFNLIATTTQRMGVAVATVANKLSLVIPFLCSLYLYGETPGPLKLLGVMLALPAVALTCLSPSTQGVHTKISTKPQWSLPLLLFVGSGIFDTLVKYVEQAYLNDNNYHDYLIAAFSMATLAGAVTVTTRIARKKMTFQWKTIPMGIALGIPNYFSLWFLMKVLKNYPHNSSAIIPINNIGVVIFSTIAAAIIFREKLSRQNRWGILLAIVAMGLMTIGAL